MAPLPGAPAEPLTTGRKTYLLLCAFLPLLPLQNIIYKLDGPLRAIPGVNLLNLGALFTLVAWLAATLGKGRPLLGPARFNGILVLYVGLTYLGLWRAVSYVGAQPPISPSADSFVFWKDYMTVFLLFFMVSNGVHDERSMRRLTVLCFAVLPYMVFVHNDQLQWANSWHYDDDMRVRGTMMNLGSNELAAFYVIGLAVSLGLLTSMKGLRWKAYLAGAVAMFGWGVGSSYSRSAYLASILAITLVVAVRGRKLLLLLLILVPAAPFLLPASVQDRFNMIGSDQTEKDESTRKRIELWDVALERFKDNPILGTGTRSFTKLNRYGMDTHNMFLKVLCELGVFGITLFVLQFLVGLRQSWVLLRRRPTPFAAGLGAGLLGATAAAMFLNVFGDRSSYLAVTGQYWVWHAMAGRILRAEEKEGGWTA